MLEISEEVINKASQGDEAAFEMIYRKYCGFVYNVAFRIVHTADDAQETTQEVFILLYRKLRGFRFQSSLKTWIYRVTINTAINMSKKRAKERENKVEYNDQIGPTVSAQIHDEIDREHYENFVRALLNCLTPDQRACIVLRNIEGLSYQEMAEVLKININTVRSRLKRARQVMMNLRKEVIDDEL